MTRSDDPLLALLPDEVPMAFLALPPEEQSWRGRFFLMCWGTADLPENFAWANALQGEPGASEVRALVESVDDEQIAEQVRLRNEHYLRLAAEATEAQRRGRVGVSFAAVQFDRQADGSWKPVGVWWATTEELQARMLPGDADRDGFAQYWLGRAEKPVMPDGTQGDWQDWLRNACWQLTNGHTRMLVACVPAPTLDATYQYEVLSEQAG